MKMTQEFVVGLGRQAVEMTLMLATPMLGLGLAVGLMVSIFQAVTMIQEMTLTFVPKIIAVMLGLLLFLPWMLRTMLSFTTQILTDLPNYIK
jgi:flagellar biosynthetic protein FliQ